jgi:GNAT superfamily N-acetyltransferase
MAVASIDPNAFVIRKAAAHDQRYIASTWWHSMLGRNRAPRIRRRINAQIDRVLDDMTTRCLVATNGRDRILGWLVYADAPIGRVIHYLYVRDDERERGVGSRLMAAAWPGSTARVVVTMKGPVTEEYLARRPSAQFISIEEILK